MLKKIASENSDLYNQYKEMKKEDYRIAEEERQKWLSQKDYKGMDYYQFKDARAIKFENSEQGKAQRKVEKQLAEKTEQYVKTNMKKVYDTPLNEVERRYSTSAKTYGQDIRNRTLNQLLYPGSAELSKKTTPPRGNKKGKIKVTLTDGSVFVMTNPSWHDVERLRKQKIVKSIE